MTSKFCWPRRSNRIGLLVVILLCVPTATYAQLTPEQQRILNQLPPGQREQAMDALRQLQTQGSVAVSQVKSADSQSPTAISVPSVDIVVPEGADALRARAGSRVVINLTPKASLSDIALTQLAEDPVLNRIVGSNFYILDDGGLLKLPGLTEVPLLGLENGGIAQRLEAEPALSMFNVTARLLDLLPTGPEALKPFGYDLFEGAARGVEAVTDGPVPPDYVLGPGDSIRVQLFGNVNGIYEFEVTRDGILNLPELGPIIVAGLPFSEFRNDLNNRVKEMLIGTQVSITMGQLRTIQVFVLGDANRPGSYVVSSLATISSTLYRSGGISRIGTLRSIELKRQGRLVTRLDLYDLLLNGDTSGDIRLQPGDVIFVPPVGDTVSIAGAVRRPAIYEIEANTTVSSLLDIAGGLNPNAYPSGSRLERINDDRQRVVISVDAANESGASVKLSPGDTLIIPEVLDETRRSVVLAGHVQRPGQYEWRPGMRLIDLVPTSLDLAPGADSNYVLIRRENSVDRSVQAVSANLQSALANPASPENLELNERDTVYVFSLAHGRQRIVAPILDELERQAKFGAPFNQVRISGQVRAPGAYPLEPGMQISDLIRAGGSMAEGAYALEAELARSTVVNGEYRSTEIIDVDLDGVINGNSASNLPLLPHDSLKISLIPEWQSDSSVVIEGEVRFPGRYQVRRGETLSQLIGRSGGVTEHAFTEGAIFLRQSLKEREREQISALVRRMESDLAALSLEAADSTSLETMRTGRLLLDQLRDTQPVGRLVIDASQLEIGQESPISADSIELNDGDHLMIPTKSQAVTVIGEVQYTTSHLYKPNLTRDDYISMSGGLTRKADKQKIYVVRASGAVVSSNGSRWFGRIGQVEIRPGDTIVIPLDTDRIRPLTFWTNVTQILYQGAIAVAAIKSFEN